MVGVKLKSRYEYAQVSIAFHELQKKWVYNTRMRASPSADSPHF